MPAMHYWFGGPALAAFIALIIGMMSLVALSYAWYQAAVAEFEKASSKAASEAQKENTKRIKELLGKALVSGSELMAQLEDKNLEQEARDVLNKTVERIDKDAKQWGEKTRTMIAAAYGYGEAFLFLNDSGYTFSSGRLPKYLRRALPTGSQRTEQR
jgi:hypothetical protein